MKYNLFVGLNVKLKILQHSLFSLIKLNELSPERSCLMRGLLLLISTGSMSLNQEISGSGFPLAAHSIVAVLVLSTTFSWGPMSMVGKPWGIWFSGSLQWRIPLGCRKKNNTKTKNKKYTLYIYSTCTNSKPPWKYNLFFSWWRGSSGPWPWKLLRWKW